MLRAVTLEAAVVADRTEGGMVSQAGDDVITADEAAGSAREAVADVAAAVATGRRALPCAEDTTTAAVPRGLMRAVEREVAVAEAAALSTPECDDATAVS